MDIFLCPISKLKKKFWKLWFFPFFQPFFILEKLQFILQNSIFHIFFMKFAFSEELSMIHNFLILIYFILINFLLFLSYIIHKYLIWVIFILKSSYKVVQKLSKVVQKLSSRSEKIRKNPKNSEKIPKKSNFFTFFLMVSAIIWQKVILSFIM